MQKMWNSFKLIKILDSVKSDGTCTLTADYKNESTRDFTIRDWNLTQFIRSLCHPPLQVPKRDVIGI